MISLITGTPGAGKTAWTVQELIRLPSQRKIYIHGIPELKIAHEPIFCTSELCDHCRETTHLVEYEDEGGKYQVLEEISKPGQRAFLVEEWPLWATEGSLIVIDEVQRIWRPSASSKLPDEIAALETHRHKGLDFWLISQGPHLFHSNIRLLIGKHIHLVSMWNGRSEYEWPECRQNVTSRGDAVTRPYKLPKKIFHLYKSSSLHVKQSHRKPLAFYGLFACAFFLLVAIYFSYQRVTAHLADEAEAHAHAPAAQAEGAGAGDSASDAIIPPPAKTEKKSFPPDFMPPINGPLEHAAAYEHLIQVKSAPILIGCVNTPETGCKCYSKQAAPYPSTPDFCQAYIKGEHFNPYKG